MLRISGLSKRFGGNLALDDITFSLGEGEIGAVIGPNGAGKTTLLDAISGLISIDNGSLLLGSRDLSRLPAWERAERFLGRTFQRVKVTDSLSVRDNVVMHFRGQVGVRLLPSVFGRWKWRTEEGALRDRARVLLDGLDIIELAERRVGTLSFGQRKLVSLCGATADGLGLVLLDEPFTGVDPGRIEGVQRALRGLAKEGVIVLLVEHNLDVVTSFADRAIALDRGRLVADGLPKEVLGSEALISAYLR